MKRLVVLAAFVVASWVTVFAEGNSPIYITYNDDAGTGPVMKRARGQFGTPSKIYSSDVLGQFHAYGHNGSAFAGPKGSIEVQANQDWSTTANGTKILFKTTPDGSTTQATVATLDDNGNLSISGALSAVGLTSTGLAVDTPTNYILGAATEVTPTSGFGVFTTTGGAISWSCTNSCISTSVANGSMFTVMSSTTANITLNDTAYIQLSTTTTSTDRVLSNPGDNLVLRLLSGVWYEVSFSTGHE